ncbi:hypothetical protein HK097_000763, partial [Rhizophlyctis rosea]
MQTHRDFSPVHRRPSSPPYSRDEKEQSSDLRTTFDRRSSVDLKDVSQKETESPVATIPDVEEKPVKVGVKRRKGESSKQPRKSIKLTDNSETPPEGTPEKEKAVAKKRKAKAGGVNGKEKEKDGVVGAEVVVGGDGTAPKGRKKKAG